MSRTSRLLILALAGTTIVAAAWFCAPHTCGEVRVPCATALPCGEKVTNGTAVGMTGCLAAACHGGPAAGTLAGTYDASTWQSSGTCWVARDPHAGAYDSLVREKPRRPGQPTAREIMATLGRTKRATEDARCLACHTNPSLADPGRTTEPRVLELRREGVSCEACHGNAGGWLREHTDGRTTGMTPLSEIGDRATACLGCHVGAPADKERGYPVRDMNHDMIAAGHPRLDFDFAEYLRRLPKHWHQKQATPDGPKREWFVGRVAHAEAACRLLADRADRAGKDDERTPWPEFAEFDCASCHHTIRPGREEPPPVGRMAGTLRWQTIWPLTHDGGAGFSPLRDVRNAMQARRPRQPEQLGADPGLVAGELRTLRRSLAGLTDAEFEARTSPLIQWTVPAREDWDAAGQMFQGLAARERSRTVRSSGRPEFARGFDAFRRKDWSAARDALDDLSRP